MTRDDVLRSPREEWPSSVVTNSLHELLQFRVILGHMRYSNRVEHKLIETKNRIFEI